MKYNRKIDLRFFCSVMKEVTGDLVKLAKNGEFDVIVHGCNCECIMGGGIAKQIRQAFPTAYDADRGTSENVTLPQPH